MNLFPILQMRLNITACRLFWPSEIRFTLPLSRGTDSEPLYAIRRCHHAKPSLHNLFRVSQIRPNITACRLFQASEVALLVSLVRWDTASTGPFWVPKVHLPHSLILNTLNAIWCCYRAKIRLRHLFSFHEPDCIFRAFIFLIYDITSNFCCVVPSKISAVR